MAEYKLVKCWCQGNQRQRQTALPKKKAGATFLPKSSCQMPACICTPELDWNRTMMRFMHMSGVFATSRNATLTKPILTSSEARALEAATEEAWRAEMIQPALRSWCTGTLHGRSFFWRKMLPRARCISWNQMRSKRIVMCTSSRHIPEIVGFIHAPGIGGGTSQQLGFDMQAVSFARIAFASWTCANALYWGEERLWNFCQRPIRNLQRLDISTSRAYPVFWRWCLFAVCHLLLDAASTITTYYSIGPHCAHCIMIECTVYTACVSGRLVYWQLGQCRWGAQEREMHRMSRQRQCGWQVIVPISGRFIVDFLHSLESMYCKILCYTSSKEDGTITVYVISIYGVISYCILICRQTTW